MERNRVVFIILSIAKWKKKKTIILRQQRYLNFVFVVFILYTEDSMFYVLLTYFGRIILYRLLLDVKRISRYDRLPHIAVSGTIFFFFFKDFGMCTSMNENAVWCASARYSVLKSKNSNPSERIVLVLNKMTFDRTLAAEQHVCVRYIIIISRGQKERRARRTRPSRIIQVLR